MLFYCKRFKGTKYERMSSFLRIGMSDVYFSIKAVALLKTESIFSILIRTYITTDLFKAASKSGSSL